MNNIFFLSGIARSGSTLLGSILNQNPDIYVSPTSPLMDLFCLTEEACVKLDKQYTYDKNTVVNNLYKSLAPTFYQHIDQPYIIDKHRGWPRNVEQIKQFITNNPKIICTYRPVAENICSFLKLVEADPDNSVDADLRNVGLSLTTYNRAMMIWHNYSKNPYTSLKIGLEYYRQHLLIVNYNDIVDDTENQINRIYNFLEIPKFDHTYDNITNTCAEVKDTEWGFKGLHVIRNTISKTSSDPRKVLGRDLFEFFENFDRDLMLID